MLKAAPKDGFRLAAMLFKFERFLLMQPLADFVAPAKGQRQHAQEALQAQRVSQVRRFQTEAARFQSREQGFDAKSNTWQRYTHDGAEVRSEENSDGSWVSYVNGDGMDDHLMQRRRTPGQPVINEYYLSDHQGSLRALTDANGNVVNGVSYDG